MEGRRRAGVLGARCGVGGEDCRCNGDGGGQQPGG